MSEFQGLAEWCARWLGSPPSRELFRVSHLSTVVGLELDSGRQVVVKVRPSAERLSACAKAQTHLRRAGFPCPAVLAGPLPVNGMTVTAESYEPQGVPMEEGPDLPDLFAQALADLVEAALAPEATGPLTPEPPWVGWNHDGDELWPMPDDLDQDLNHHPGPGWLDDAGHRVRRRLRAWEGRHIVGHGDWDVHNLTWSGHRVAMVHDWDSLVSLPEAALAGTALPHVTIGESERFARAYQRARGRSWSGEERAVSWAAGLWVRAFNAKKALVRGDGLEVVDRLRRELGERLLRAGV